MRILFLICCLLMSSVAYSQNPMTLSSPDGNPESSFLVNIGNPVYSVTYNDEIILANSPLGLVTRKGDVRSHMSFVKPTIGDVDKEDMEVKIKQSFVEFQANTLKVTLENDWENQISVLFRLSKNDITFRHELPVWGKTRAAVVIQEATGFNFPASITIFHSPMMRPITGFAHTTFSCERDYTTDLFSLLGVFSSGW